MDKQQSLNFLKSPIAKYLGSIEKHFHPDAKFTLIVRMPGNDNADVIVTTDRAIDVIKVLGRTTDDGKNPILEELKKYKPCGPKDKLIPLSAVEKFLQNSGGSVEKHHPEPTMCTIDILIKAVDLIEQWHGSDVFPIYYAYSPEMKSMRDVLGDNYKGFKAKSDLITKGDKDVK